MADHHVDRPDVYAQQCVQQTGTNRPRAWICARARYGDLEVLLETQLKIAGTPDVGPATGLRW